MCSLALLLPGVNLYFTWFLLPYTKPYVNEQNRNNDVSMNPPTGRTRTEITGPRLLEPNLKRKKKKRSYENYKLAQNCLTYMLDFIVTLMSKVNILGDPAQRHLGKT